MEGRRRSQAILIEPAYGYASADGRPMRPRAGLAMAEWLDAINVLKGRSRVVPLVTAVFHVASGVASAVYLIGYMTWESVPSRIFSFAIGLFFGVVYHSLWWHRYCTHKAFVFRSPAWARVFAWTNPLFYRDETFVIPHRVHHQVPDQPGDPYTPMAGWLVCYLSAETQQRLNTDISRDEYESLARGLSHTGTRLNSYDAFRQTGSVESVGSFLLHAVGAQVLWVVPLALFGGTLWVLSFYSAVFWSMFVVRDFNYRGHSDEADEPPATGWARAGGRALNHRLYGYMSGEWHHNHHACPSSARMGFAPGQVDLGFLVIRLLHRVGIVTSYTDHHSRFLAAQAGDGVLSPS